MKLVYSAKVEDGKTQTIDTAHRHQFVRLQEPLGLRCGLSARAVAGSPQGSMNSIRRDQHTRDEFSAPRAPGIR